jgi:hypothetical protein
VVLLRNGFDKNVLDIISDLGRARRKAVTFNKLGDSNLRIIPV